MAVGGITGLLNFMAVNGVFSYVIPFLLIFAVVFAVLKKANIFEDNNAINAIIAISIGLLALLNDHVPIFFEELFPRFGIGLSIFLVLIILLGFFYKPDENGKWGGAVSWIGWLTGIGVVIWAWSAWDDWGAGGIYGFGDWFSEYIWSLIILGVVIGLIVWIVKASKNTTPAGP